MTTAHALQGALNHHQMLVEELRRRFPDADSDTIADTAAGASDLEEALAEVARSLGEDEAWAEVCKTRADALDERRGRHLHRARLKRDAIANAMSAAGIKTVTAADVTLSLAAGKPKVMVTNEAAVIAEGYGKPPVVVVDRVALREALAAGNEILGATLGNGEPTLTVRVR